MFLSYYLDVEGAVLVDAHSLVAHFAIATASAICPGKVSSLADQLAAGLSRAPQLGTWLHVWAGFGARPKCQLTLTLQIVVETRQGVRQRHLFLRLIQETVSYSNNAERVYKGTLS